MQPSRDDSPEPTPAESDPDVETSVPLADVQGTLALDTYPRLDPPQPRASPRPDAADYLPEWIPQFTQRVAEVAGGDRPATQLVRWTSEAVYADLNRRANLTARAGGFEPGRGKVQLLRPKVISIHPRPVDDDTFEVAILLRYGDRIRALAARFERSGLAWICTALDFGERSSGRQC